jgi:SMI1-KNR4 cell-wall
MKNIISKLLKFSDDILELGATIQDNRIKNFENACELILPNDFKKFITKINGFSVMGTEVYGFDKEKANSIENIYYREHRDVIVPQYKHLVPFSPDGRGNFYCLDTLNQLKNGDFPIVFWVSNYYYTINDTPEIITNNFTEWVDKIVIGWILEDYNYDGTEKN